MNIKALLKDPLGHTLKQWYQADSDDEDNELLEMASAVEVAKEAIEHTRTEMQLCVKQLANNQDEEIQPLLESKYNSIREQLQTLKRDRKQHFNNLLSNLRTRSKQASIPQLYQPEADDPSDDPTTLTIEMATRSHRDEWNQYVQKHPKASAYHYFGWKEISEGNHKTKSFYLIARNTRQTVVGVLPLAEQRENGYLYAVSMPECHFGGALADAPDIAKRLYWKASELGKARNWRYIEYRTSFGEYTWLATKSKPVIVSIVPDNRSQLQQQLAEETLTNIDRLSIHNPTLHYGQHDLLNNFYAIYTHNSRAVGEKPLAKKFFASLIENLPNSLILVGKIRNNPVVTAFLLQHDDMLEVRWQSNSWPNYAAPLNDWLYREILLHAIETGISYVKFDDSMTTNKDAQDAWSTKSIGSKWHYWLGRGVTLHSLDTGREKKLGLFSRLAKKITR